jgi:hypothetical protein
MKVTRYVVLVLCCGLATTSVLLGGWDWSEKELECAGSIGVDLTTVPRVSDEKYIRYLAWIADLVIYGSVEEVSHDIRGTYLTVVRVKVSAFTKGDGDPGATVYVNLRSGPFYSSERDAIFRQSVAGETSFTKGEEIVLFLTSTGWDPDQPSGYALPSDHYCLVDNGKWNVKDGAAWHNERPSVSISTEWIDQEVDTVVATQSGSCE